MSTPNSPGLRALIIDPDPQVREQLAALLQELRFEVDSVRGYMSGVKALDQALESHRAFDAILVSDQLAIVGAAEMIRRIREKNRKAIFLLTTHSNNSSSPGVDRYELQFHQVRLLSIPCDLDSLRKALWPPEVSAPSAAPSAWGGADDVAPSKALDRVSPGLPESSRETSEARSSGEFAMWPQERDIIWPTELPSLVPPAQSRPAPTPPRAAPSQPSLPAAAPATSTSPPAPVSSSKGGGRSTWETLAQKVGGWFKKKQPNDRLKDAGKDPPLADWAKPVGADFVEPPSRSPKSAERATTDPSAAEPDRDQVDCTVYAPQAVSPGETIMIQAMLHTPAEARLAAAMAKEFDDSATARGARALDTTIARGSKVAFQLTAPGLKIDDAAPPPIIWLGHPEGVQFGVTAPDTFPPRTVICTVLVTLESVPIGQIKFKLSVQRSAAAPVAPLMSSSVQPAVERQPHTMTRYQMVFISYASADRDEVLKRVQMLKRFNVNFFQDVLNLEPGERWEQSLYKHIDQSDLFLLFWSSAAKNSNWVREEVKYALARRGANEAEAPEIVPIVLEGPPVPEPLPELSHLHFNDQILHFVANRYLPAAP